MLQAYPWALVSLVDDRISPTDRQCMADKWDAKHVCCLPGGFARKLKARGITGDQLLHDPDLALVLLWFSRVVRMQICDVEWRHHRNRSRSSSTGQTRWTTFQANFVNGEAMGSQVARLRALELLREPVRQGMLIDPPVRLGANQPRTRSARAQDIFREDMMRRDRLMEKKFVPASAEYWNQVRREWGALEPEAKADYEARAIASVVEAQQGRELKRQRVAVGAVPAVLPGVRPSADDGAVVRAGPCRRCNAAAGLQCQRALALNAHCRAYDRSRDVFDLDKAFHSYHVNVVAIPPVLCIFMCKPPWHPHDPSDDAVASHTCADTQAFVA
jgi:hypothetical protein